MITRTIVHLKKIFFIYKKKE